jgi:hypothetical protein
MKLNELKKKLGMQESLEFLANNQVIIYFENGAIFQSYDTIIVVSLYGVGDFVKKDWQISPTTSKYLYQYLHISGSNKKKKLEEGIKEEILKTFEE